MTEYYTISEAAELLKLAPNTVRKFLREGKLSGSKLGRIWRVTQADIDAMMARHRKGGNG